MELPREHVGSTLEGEASDVRESPCMSKSSDDGKEATEGAEANQNTDSLKTTRCETMKRRSGHVQAMIPLVGLMRF